MSNPQTKEKNESLIKYILVVDVEDFTIFDSVEGGVQYVGVSGFRM